MSIVGGLDIHRKQITFDYLDTGTGQVQRGQISPADREHLRAWLARFADCEDVAFAVEGYTGWRYVAEELAGAARPYDPPARSRNPAAIRAREQTQASLDQRNHDHKSPKSDACDHRRIQVRRMQVRWLGARSP
jgi:hypothetical protein